MNILLFVSNTIIIKFFLSIILTCLIVNQVLLIVYNLYIHVLLLNNISILLNLKHHISEIILTLILTIKNGS